MAGKLANLKVLNHLLPLPMTESIMLQARQTRVQSLGSKKL